MRFSLAGIFLIVLLFAAVSAQGDKNCATDGFGRCLRPCEPGTHRVVPGCGGTWKGVNTCEHPTGLESPAACDQILCVCDEPTVRNTDGKCVKLEECPNKTKEEE